MVTGDGSVWYNQTYLDVGGNGSSNLLTIAGGSVVASNVAISYGVFASNNVLLVTGGSLVVANSLGTGPLMVSRFGGQGSLILNSGSVTADMLIATHGANSVVTFNGGTLNSGGTFVTNSQMFVVGNGSSAATFHLSGGVHCFANDLGIRSSGSLTGCGTITGNVLVDAGGMVSADCGSTLNFTGAVTNNSSVVALNGTTVNFYGPVVNNGTIDVTGGGVHFYSTLQNNGVVMGVTNSWIDGSAKWETATNWWLGTGPSSGDAADLITNAGNNTVTIDGTTAGSFPGTMTIRNLTVSAPGAAINTLFLDNAGTNTPLRVWGVLALGTNGAMVVNNSAVLGTNSVSIGNSSASSSLVVSNGGSLIVTNGSGTGSVVVNGGSLLLGVGTFKTDNLVVTNGGAVQHTQTYQVDNASVTVASGTSQFGSNLVVGGSANSTGTVNVTGGSLVATNASTVIASNGVGSVTISSNATMLSALTSLAIGSNSTASLSIQDSASMTVLSNLTAGSGPGATGIVSVTGGRLVVSNGVIGVGNNGTYTDGSGVGQMTVSNATVIAQQIVLGNNRGGSGGLSIGRGGIVNMLPGALGCAACGMKLNDLTLDGGTVVSPDNDVYAGQGIPGAMIVNDGAATFRSAFVGVDNTGSVSMPGGTMNVLSNLVVGMNPGGTGVVMITGGSLTATNGVIGVGNDGTSTNGLGVGSMAVSNGTVTASSILLGSSAGGEGHLTLDDGGMINCAGGNSTLVVNGFDQIGGSLGWTNIGSAFYCGYAHPGAYALSNGTASFQDVYVGYDNVGTTTIAGGTMTILSRLIVGQMGSPVSTGAVWMTGGQLTIANYSIIGSSGLGQMTISNGIVTATDVFIGNSGNPGTLTLAGGTLTVNGIVLPNPNSQFIFSGGCLNVNAITSANGQILTAGNGASPATWNLLGGITSLGNGLHVSANVTVMGFGTITGSVVNYGLIAPVGGDLSFTGPVTNYGLIITNSSIHFLGGLSGNGMVLDAAADADGDGMNNLSEVLTGTNPTNSASLFHITAATRAGNDVLVSWSTVGGKRYVVQASTGAGGNYSTSFADISPVTAVPGTGESSANYLDLGGATNFPSRYYRVRLVQ